MAAAAMALGLGLGVRREEKGAGEREECAYLSRRCRRVVCGFSRVHDGFPLFSDGFFPIFKWLDEVRRRQEHKGVICKFVT